jgi:glycosyltransferase involved in cell wall biosynthesis
VVLGARGADRGRTHFVVVRVVVDVTPLFNPLTGIGHYWVGMLDGLVQASEGRDEIVAFAVTGPRRRRSVLRALDGLAVERRLVTVPPSANVWRTLWSRVGYPPVERLAGELDVFHFSEWLQPRQRRGVRTTTIHDLVPLRFPEWVSPVTRRMHGRRDAIAAASCDVIFCNARYTADDVREHLGVPEERLRVAYPGLDPRLHPEGEQTSLGAPYVLSVATDEPRKNLGAAVEAIRILRSRGSELELALSGLSGWGDQVAPEPGVRRLGYVADEQLPALFRGAAAFCYPSRFEGFGIPVVEAMACGTPAICSTHPSLDEAAGGIALRADADDPEAFADAIERAVERREELREPGLRHAARFTRRACGEAVLAGYRSALASVV